MRRNDALATLARRAGLALLMLAALPLLPAAAQQGSQDIQGLKLSGDQPIQIESDKLEVRDKESTAVFTGNVNVVQGETVMKSGRMVVHYVKGSETAATTAAGTGNIESIEVDGKVYVKSSDQIATGDRGRFDMKSQILVLEGEKVVLTQGDNVLVGCRLVANMATGKSQLDGCAAGKGSGRVKVLLTPQKKGQQ